MLSVTYVPAPCISRVWFIKIFGKLRGKSLVPLEGYLYRVGVGCLVTLSGAPA